jgi:hypothetical protein
LGVSVGDIWMLDIVVIVVLVVLIVTEVRMLESISMSQMAASSRDEIMEPVSGVWWIVN